MVATSRILNLQYLLEELRAVMEIIRHHDPDFTWSLYLNWIFRTSS